MPKITSGQNGFIRTHILGSRGTIYHFGFLSKRAVPFSCSFLGTKMGSNENPNFSASPRKNFLQSHVKKINVDTDSLLFALHSKQSKVTHSKSSLFDLNNLLSLIYEHLTQLSTFVNSWLWTWLLFFDLRCLMFYFCKHPIVIFF